MTKKLKLPNNVITLEDFPEKSKVLILSPSMKNDRSFPRNRIGQNGVILQVREEGLCKIIVITVLFRDGSTEDFFPNELNKAFF